MHGKHANFFQRHVEKMILGAAALLLVLIAVYLFAANPFAVEGEGRAAGERLGPRALEQRIREQAETLQRQLETSDDLETTIAGRTPPSFAGDFTARIEGAIAPREQLLVRLGGPGLMDFDDMPEPDPYHVPRPPVPSQLTAVSGYGTMGDAGNRNLQQRLNQFVRNDDTGDFLYASVGATFDMDEWLDRLEADPPEGMQRLPGNWIRLAQVISSVHLIREEFDPQSQQWVNRTRIQPVPYYPSPIVPDTAREWATDEADELVRRLQERQRQVVRPDFVPLEGGAWQAPQEGVGQLDAEDHLRLQELNEQIERHERQISQLERRLGIDEDGRQRDRQREAPEEFFDEGMGGPGRAARGGRTPQEDRLYQNLERLEDRVGEMRAERDEMLGIERDAVTEQDRRRRGFDGMPPEMRDRMGEMDEMERRMMEEEMMMREGPARQRVEMGERMEGEVRVWAHDLTVEPGKTYRYRVVVSTMNPLFRRTQLSREQAAEYYNVAALGPDPQELVQSDWSTPVEVDREQYFFMVGGSPSDQTADVEVWRLYAGAWRADQFSVAAGDLIRGQATVQIDGEEYQLPMAAPATLIDVLEPDDGDTGSQMLYFDQELNEMAMRSLEEDVNSSRRIRLQNEASLIRELQAARR